MQDIFLTTFYGLYFEVMLLMLYLPLLDICDWYSLNGLGWSEAGVKWSTHSYLSNVKQGKVWITAIHDVIITSRGLW